MKSIAKELNQQVRDAMKRAGAKGDPLLKPSQDAKFGDYQSNCAMGVAKRLGRKPRDVANDIVAALDVADMCEPPEIAGPGFINFRIKPAYVAQRLMSIPPCEDPSADRVGLEPTREPKTVVVDLSSPNLAKEMHVGHLRSTVIGDCISRVLEFEGHTVHRENHVGDWGTQFGMLVAYLRATKPDIIDRPGDLAIGDLESFYIEAKAKFDSDEKFRDESRETVVKLQGGDEPTRKIWKAFCDESLRHCHAIYDRLGVRLIDRGESFYAEGMKEVITRLEAMMSDRNGDNAFVRISEGALCLFMDGFTTRDGEPLPLMVRKSDGGFNYATSDLATMIHRVERLGADRIIYVVGIPQRQHFQMLFAAVRQAKWVAPDVDLKHLAFGSVLGKTGRPFKTREGGSVKLKDVLDEAVARARSVITESAGTEARAGRAMTDAKMDEIAERVGLAAIKYFDLSHAISSDYKFDLDSMLAMEGNTAPYMMYAYARIRSIGRKAGIEWESLPSDTPIVLEHPAEIALAKKLVPFVDILETVSNELRTIALTEYLYELAKTFSRFYDRKIGVRVIDAEPEETRLSRLRLCDLTARTLRLGLSLLGIETVEEM